jgi:hypothetical protein
MNEQTKKIAKEFKKNMQQIADEGNCTISVSSNIDGKRSEERVIATPKNTEAPKPEIEEISTKEKNSSQDLKISKIKYDGTQVEIQYEIVMETTDDIKVVLKSYDKPKEEFILCLSSLAKFVEDICQLEKGYCDEADIRGVSLSWSHDIMGAVITALIPVDTANSPVCLNTPHLPSEQYNENGQSPVLPRACTTKINQLIEHAEAYINGDRDIPEDNQIKMDI